MPPEPLVALDRVSHHFGSGALRKQILFGVSLEVQPGEIVILTGPSGSGKTTLLTLIGALRSAQEGSLKVLGQELRGASETVLVSVRRRIGYIFQLHNLLDALTVSQNVQMSLAAENGLSRREAEARAREMLAVSASKSTRVNTRTSSPPGRSSGSPSLALSPGARVSSSPTSRRRRSTRSRGAKSSSASMSWPSGMGARSCW